MGCPAACAAFTSGVCWAGDAGANTDGRSTKRWADRQRVIDQESTLNIWMLGTTPFVGS